jgi:glutamate 5-kinase
MSDELKVELVGKIGSMALIRQEDKDINYNIFSRLGAELKPGMVWVSSGATEIGRLDYMKRNGGQELAGDEEEVKADYAAQGQAILMENYRRFISPEYSIRQLLVEHTHFNDLDKSNHIKSLLLRCTEQGAIPIVNYNDPVSFEENRKMELSTLRRNRDSVVECIDNDETAAVIAALVHAKRLLILTSVEGIYLDPADPSTLVECITGCNADETVAEIIRMQDHCQGASRQGAGGAKAKLAFCIEPARGGTEVIIGHARHKISDLIEGRVPCTRIRIGL